MHLYLQIVVFQNNIFRKTELDITTKTNNIDLYIANQSML